MHSSNVANVGSAGDQTYEPKFTVCLLRLNRIRTCGKCSGCQRDGLCSYRQTSGKLSCIRTSSERRRQRNVLLNIFDVTFNFRFPPGYDACSMRTTSLATKWRIFDGSSQGLHVHADSAPMSCAVECSACISPWLVSNMILIWKTHATFFRSLLNVWTRAPHYRRAFHIIIATQRFNNAWKLKSC